MSLKRINKQALQGIPASVPEMEALAISVLQSNREMERLVAEKAAAMEAAAAPFTAALEAKSAEVADGLKKLEMWAEINRPLFGEQRSLELPGAHRMGWRLGNWKTSPGKGSTWKTITEKLVDLVRMKRARADELLRTKVEPDRESMVALREDPEVAAVLQEAGVEVAQEESFFIA